MTRFPSLFVYEIGVGGNVRIGWIKKIRRRNRSAVIEYEMESAFPPIPSSAIQEIKLILDITEWEFKRTHWAVKDVDLFSVFLEAGLITKAQINRINRPILTSSTVVVDFSGRNPNVMYETGIAHTLGRQVIPISQSINDVPFDLRHHRFLEYLPNTEGLSEMQTELEKRLRTINS